MTNVLTPSYITKGEKTEHEFVLSRVKTMAPNATNLQVLRKLRASLLAVRESSLQEDTWIALGRPLYYSSRTSIFVDTRLPHQRSDVSLPYEILQAMDSSETNVWSKGIWDAYIRRPRGVKWEAMSLFEFARWFMVAGTQEDAAGGEAGKAARADEEFNEEGNERLDPVELDAAIAAQHAQATAAPPTYAAGDAADQDEEIEAEAAEAAEVERQINGDNDESPATGEPTANIRRLQEAFKRQGDAPLAWHPLWGTNDAQISTPPFSMQGNVTPLFDISNGRGLQFLRMRTQFRCIKSTPSFGNPAVAALSQLMLHVPFRNPYVTLLGRNKHSPMTDATGEELQRAVLQWQPHLHTVGHARNMPANWAIRIEHVLLNAHLLDDICSLFEHRRTFDGRGVATAAGVSEDGPNEDGGCGRAAHQRAYPTFDEEEDFVNPDGTTQEWQPNQAGPRPENGSIAELLAWFYRSLNPEQLEVFRRVHLYLQEMRQWKPLRDNWERHWRTSTSEQRIALCAKMPAMPTAPLLFVSGPAGTGKSHLIEALDLLLRSDEQHFNQNGSVLITALTGTAALNIHGQTVHSAFDLTRPDDNAAIAKFRARYKNLRLLICDEVSMMSSTLLNRLNTRLNGILCDAETDGIDSSVPPPARTSHASFFGNCMVMLFGDFCQLPPVAAVPIYSPISTEKVLSRGEEHLLVHSSNTGFRHVFSLFQYCPLKRQVRQAADPEYGKLLTRMRRGALTDEDIALLNTRVMTDGMAYLNTPLGDVIHIYPTHADVTRQNRLVAERKAALSDEPLFVIERATSRAVRSANAGPPGEDIDQNDGTDTNTSNRPTELPLFRGLRVILLRNAALSSGLVNGSLGNVVDIEWRTPPTIQQEKLITISEGVERRLRFVHIKHGTKDELPERVWVHFPKAQITGDIVGVKQKRVVIDGVATTIIGVSPVAFQDKHIKGFALELAAAYALTVHKAQGISTDQIIIGIPPLPPLKSAARGRAKTSVHHRGDGDGGGDDEAVARGGSYLRAIAYVAFSRCRTLQGVHLLHAISRREIINSERVSTFYSTVRRLGQPCADETSYERIPCGMKGKNEQFEVRRIDQTTTPSSSMGHAGSARAEDAAAKKRRETSTPPPHSVGARDVGASPAGSQAPHERALAAADGAQQLSAAEKQANERTRREQLYQNVARFGLVLERIPPDGNCALESLRRAMRHAGRPVPELAEMRVAMADYIRRVHLPRFPELNDEIFFDTFWAPLRERGHVIRSWDDYLRVIQLNSIYGDQLCLLALAHVYALHICTVEGTDASQPSIVSDGESPRDRSTLLTVVLLHHDFTDAQHGRDFLHFDLLRDPQDPPRTWD